MKHEGPPTEHITGIKIPDDDAHNWMNKYREMGFSTDDIDSIMVRLNETYLSQRFGQLIQDELSNAVQELEQRKGGPLHEHAREWGCEAHLSNTCRR